MYLSLSVCAMVTHICVLRSSGLDSFFLNGFSRQPPLRRPAAEGHLDLRMVGDGWRNLLISPATCGCWMLLVLKCAKDLPFISTTTLGPWKETHDLVLSQRFSIHDGSYTLTNHHFCRP